MPATASPRPIWRTKVPDLTTDLDLPTADLVELLNLAQKVKKAPQRYAKTLSGKYLSLLFEKPSLRTRLTFELAIKQLGGDAVTSIGPSATANRSRMSRGIWIAGPTPLWPAHSSTGRLKI